MLYPDQKDSDGMFISEYINPEYLFPDTLRTEPESVPFFAFIDKNIDVSTKNDYNRYRI